MSFRRLHSSTRSFGCVQWRKRRFQSSLASFLCVLPCTNTNLTVASSWIPSKHRESQIAQFATEAKSMSTWEAFKDEALTKCVLPMSPSSHKGSSGRVGVLGGSERYTGAPYYTAMASLKVGADLAYVFCAQEAAMPIKCYSPELMVAPVYNAQEFDLLVKQNRQDDEQANALVENMVSEVVSMMDRMHVLVVGPGMGRSPLVMRAAAQIIKEAKARDLAMVLDADALYMLTLEPNRDLLQNYERVILTPNVMEYKRLIQAHVLSEDPSESLANEAIIVKKGRSDAVMTKTEVVLCEEEGGLKRSGGLGDLLAGTLATFVAWNQIMEKREQEHDLVGGCWSACCVVKRATKHAFDKKRRAMTAPDVLAVLGETVDEMTT